MTSRVRHPRRQPGNGNIPPLYQSRQRATTRWDLLRQEVTTRPRTATLVRKRITTHAAQCASQLACERSQCTRYNTGQKTPAPA